MALHHYISKIITVIELAAEQLNEWKITFAKDGIVYDTDDDYREAINNLEGYFDVLIQIDLSLKSVNTCETELTSG